MNRVLQLTFLTALLLTTGFAQLQQSSIAGAFQWCPFHCETFKINRDFTFEYLVYGDLFNNERTSGKWTFMSKDKIHLISRPVKLVSKVEEQTADPNDKISIHIQDSVGAVFPGIIVRFSGAGGQAQCTTDADGRCEIPRIASFEIRFGRYRETYRIVDPSTSRLNIELNAWLEPLVDNIFVIRKKVICNVDPKLGTVGDCFRRLSPKRASSLFPLTTIQ